MMIEKKAKGKRKAIIGIAMAAIMIASVLAVMVPMGSARDAIGAIEVGDVVYRGEQGLDVSAIIFSGGAFYGIKDSTADGGLLTVSDNTSFTVPKTAKIGPYNKTSREGTTADIIVQEPSITGDVFLVGTTDSIVGKSIPAGTKITIRACPNFGGLLKEAGTGNWSKIKIKLIDPDGIEMVDKIDANASEIEIYKDTTGWDTGTWKVKIVSDKAMCNEVDVSSPEYEFTIRSEELVIEAIEETIGKGENIIVKVGGNPQTYYYLIVTGIKRVAPGETSVAPKIVYTNDVKDLDDALGDAEGDAYPATATELGEANLAAWIKTGSDGIADVKIDTTGADTRTYTIKVYETTFVLNPDAAGGPTYDTDANVAASALTTDDDEVNVKVVKATVTFDIPASVIIGEEVTIKGAISAGDYVDIVILDYVVVEDDKAVDENNEFEVKWDTAGLTAGSYTIEVYIDFQVGGPAEVLADFDGVDEDGKTTIRLVAPGLTAEQPRNVIAEGDAYTIEGMAPGTDDVDYVLVGPNGWKSGSAAGLVNGILVSSTSVLSDNEFSENITMTAGLDTGMWKALVLAPGRDGVYEGTGQGAGDLTLAALGVTAGKNQDQIVAIINDQTSEAVGSDDLLVMRTFMVATARVDLDPIASVAVGEPLVVTGTTNREPETTITISTFAGPMDLLAVIAEVEWPTKDEGVFNATIDTTDAVAGTYTLKADDGDGHTDTATVKILPAITPTSMRLYKNWNFISVPKKLADGNNTFEQVFDSVNTSGHSIFYYNLTEGWRAVTATEEVKPLWGYWIYSAEDIVLNLTYDTYPLRTPPTRPLYKGWNAIGFSDTTAAAANSALTSIEKSWAYLLGFDAATQKYESAIINNDDTGGVHDEDNLMYPMKGYWVYVTEDCELAGISV